MVRPKKLGLKYHNLLLTESLPSKVVANSVAIDIKRSIRSSYFKRPVREHLSNSIQS